MGVETEAINRILSADVLTLMAVLLVMVGGVLVWVARGMTNQNKSAGDVSLKVLGLHEKQVESLGKLNTTIEAQTAYIKAQSDAEAGHQKELVRTLSDVADVLAYIKKGLHDVLVGENKTHEGLSAIQKTTAGTADKLDSVMSKLAENDKKLDDKLTAMASVLTALPVDIGGAIERGLGNSLKELIRGEIDKVLSEREAKNDETQKRVDLGSWGVIDASMGADAFDIGTNERAESGVIRNGDPGDGGDGGSGSGAGDGGGDDSGSGE